MPKKRVGVSLRKPSAPERAPKSAAALDAAQATSEAAPLDTLQVVALQSGVISTEAAPSVIATSDVPASDIASSDIAPSDMAVVASVEIAPSDAPAPLAAALLVSDPAASPVEKTIEAFVLGAAAALEQAKNEAPAEKLEEILRRGPEGYRELTIYLPENLAEALLAHCKDNALDLSKLIGTVVEQHLNAARAAVSAAVASNDSVLAVAARSLIGDLRGWVRSVLSSRIKGFRTAPVAT
jgi:hypothetical protein